RAGAIRICSTTAAVASASKPSNPRRKTMPAAPPNGHSANGRVPVSRPAAAELGLGLAELIAETEALRAQEQEALARLTRLLAGLKQFRRQGRALQAAVASLKGLKLEG